MRSPWKVFLSEGPQLLWGHAVPTELLVGTLHQGLAAWFTRGKVFKSLSTMLKLVVSRCRESVLTGR